MQGVDHPGAGDPYLVEAEYVADGPRLLRSDPFGDGSQGSEAVERHDARTGPVHAVGQSQRDTGLFQSGRQVRG
ncbi:hypothetical protein STRIP9103_09361, partial [Streptomyces ipomoeae 91-03]